MNAEQQEMVREMIEDEMAKVPGIVKTVLDNAMWTQTKRMLYGAAVLIFATGVAWSSINATASNNARRIDVEIQDRKDADQNTLTTINARLDGIEKGVQTIQNWIINNKD